MILVYMANALDCQLQTNPSRNRSNRANRPANELKGADPSRAGIFLAQYLRSGVLRLAFIELMQFPPHNFS